MTMKLIEESDRYALGLYSLVNAPRFEGGPRTVLSVLACSLSLEHWDSVRCLVRSRSLSSAVVVHRAQFDGLAQSLWRLHAATDSQIAKLAADLTGEVGSAATCLPQAEELVLEIMDKAPRQASDAIRCVNSNAWEALNSYAQVGLHPARRHEPGHPSDLLKLLLRNANALAAAAGRQIAVLSNSQTLMNEVMRLGESHASCMLTQL